MRTNTLAVRQKQLHPDAREVQNEQLLISKKHFEKGYTSNFTQEIFVIEKVLQTNPITYKIKDLNNEEIIGSFYEKELQKTKF